MQCGDAAEFDLDHIFLARPDLPSGMALPGPRREEPYVL